MKNRILTFIIGILTGIIITTLIFLIINKPINNNGMGHTPPYEFGTKESPDGNIGEPPEKTDDNMPLYQR